MHHQRHQNNFRVQGLSLWDCLSSPCCHVIKLKWLFTRLTQISKIIPKSWFPPHLHPPRHGARGDGDIALIPRGSQAHAHAILRGGSYQTCKRCLVENGEYDTRRKYLVVYSHYMNPERMQLSVLNSPFRTHCIHVWYKSYFMGFCLACSSNSFQFLVGDFNQENVRKCRGSYIISSILICRACPLSAAVQPCSANTGDPSDHYDIFRIFR